MAQLSIGDFAERTRLSAKALRIYDDLGLVVPARVEPETGYRRYDESQVERARLVGRLRRLDMPLAVIGQLLALDGPEAAVALGVWWERVEAVAGERRQLVTYLQATLRGDEPAMRDVTVRTIPARKVLSISRHVTLGGTDAFFHEAFARLRSAGPPLEGVNGAPFLIFYGEVSEDSDGPMELCRPLAVETPDSVAPSGSDLQLRIEEAHDEAYLRLSEAEMTWPAMLPFCDALTRWTERERRQPSGPLRQVLIADRRTAQPQTSVCDLSVPLR